MELGLTLVALPRMHVSFGLILVLLQNWVVFVPHIVVGEEALWVLGNSKDRISVICVSRYILR